MDNIRKTLSGFYAPAAPPGFTGRVLQKAAAPEEILSPRASRRLGASLLAAAALLVAISLSGFGEVLHRFSSHVSSQQAALSANIGESLLRFDAAKLLQSLFSAPPTPEGE